MLLTPSDSDSLPPGMDGEEVTISPGNDFRFSSCVALLLLLWNGHGAVLVSAEAASFCSLVITEVQVAVSLTTELVVFSVPMLNPLVALYLSSRTGCTGTAIQFKEALLHVDDGSISQMCLINSTTCLILFVPCGVLGSWLCDALLRLLLLCHERAGGCSCRHVGT